MSEGGTSVEPPVTMSFTPANSSRTTMLSSSHRARRSSTRSSTPDREMDNANDAASEDENGERDQPSDSEVLAKRRKTLRVNGRAAGGEGGSGNSRPGSRHSSRPSSKVASKYNTPNRDDERPPRKRSHSAMEVDNSPTRNSVSRSSASHHSHHRHSHHHHHHHHGTDNEDKLNSEKKKTSRRDRITRLAQGNPGTGRTSSGKKSAGNDLAPKIKHLKKADGEPLWRKDIQYEFLYAIFTDEQKVFTNSYDGKANQTFADVYIDAMARSSKTSKVLRDKLMTDRSSALNIAMVCLLVNIGRMNTTLNFFPEMRAQLRTYHPIPSLQTYADPNAYKQLQDAPRLKSILKGACEDRKEPADLTSLIKIDILPRTNPINLTFLLASFAPRVTEIHFSPPRDFFDLVMGMNLSSKSRARAFLWLQWFYLESNFTAEEALSNPFGPGLDAETARSLSVQPTSTTNNSRRNSTVPASDGEMDTDKKTEKKTDEKDDDGKPDDEKKIKSEKAEESSSDDDDKEGGDRKKEGSKEKSAPPPPKEPVDDALGRLLNGKPVIVPPFMPLTEEEEAKENVDLEAEIEYGNTMQEDRKRNMEAQEAGITPSRSAKKPKRRGEDDLNSVDASPAPELLRIRGRRQVFDDDGVTDSDGSRAMSPDNDFKGRRLPRINIRHGPRDPEEEKRRGSKTFRREGGGIARIILKTRPPGDEIKKPLAPGEKRPRPPTQHQLAIQENRKERVDHEVGRLIRQARAKAKRKRHNEGPFKRCWRRIKYLEDPFAKSDDEVDGWDDENSSDDSDSHRRRKISSSDGKRKSISGKSGGNGEKKKANRHRYNNGTNFPGPAGCIPLSDEEPDFGEETTTYADTLRRVTRRLGRWEDFADSFADKSSEKKKEELAAAAAAEDAGSDEGEETEKDEEMQNGDDRDDENENEDEDVELAEAEAEDDNVDKNEDDEEAEENGVDVDVDDDVKENGVKEKDGETDEEVDPDVTMNDD